jgi:hypothetical protein
MYLQYFLKLHAYILNNFHKHWRYFYIYMFKYKDENTEQMFPV